MSEADVLYVEDLAYRYGKTEVFAGASGGRGRVSHRAERGG